MVQTGSVRAVSPPDDQALTSAWSVVRRHLAPTPLVASAALGPDVHLKLETFQPTGSFKVRGGLAAVAAAHGRDGGAALVAASAGNHGLGMAFAADRLGATATVVVAETASEIKIEALGHYGATLVRHGQTYDEAEEHALELAARTGARFVSPYNDPDVIAGQATVGHELLEQLDGIGTLVIPVGGGGLLSGVGLATADAGLRIIGVEPEHSCAMGAALRAGRVVPVEIGPTMADGLAGNIEPGSVTVELVRRFAAGMVTVSEEQIADAIRFLAFEHGLVVEGSGAVSVAALRAGMIEAGDGPVVVVLTGRNIAGPLLESVLAGH